MRKGFLARSLGNILKGALGGLAFSVIIWVLHLLWISSASPSSSGMMLIIMYGVLLGAVIGMGVTRPEPRNWKHSLMILICSFLMCVFFVPLILFGFLNFTLNLQTILLSSGGLLLIIAAILVYRHFFQKPQ